jgi:hypothetical protein
MNYMLSKQNGLTPEKAGMEPFILHKRIYNYLSLSNLTKIAPQLRKFKMK